MERIFASIRESFTRLTFNEYASLLAQTGIGIVATRFSWPYVSAILTIYTAPFYPLAFVALPSMIAIKSLRRVDHPYPPWLPVLCQYLCLIAYVNATICSLQIYLPYSLLQYFWPEVPTVPQAITSKLISILNAVHAEVVHFDQLCMTLTFADSTPTNLQHIARIASSLVLSTPYNDMLALAF